MTIVKDRTIRRDTTVERGCNNLMSRLGTGITRRDWLDAGQMLLRDRGVDGITIKALTESLSISKGSFYHHFDDLSDYLEALADYFSNEQLIDFFSQARANATDDPVSRITELSKIVLKNGGRQLMFAMRAWAKNNEYAAASVRKLDEVSMRYFEDVFRELGFSKKDAKLRAFLLIAATVVDMEEELVGMSDKEFERRLLSLTLSSL